MVGHNSPVWLFFRKIDTNITQCVVRSKNNKECGAKISQGAHSSTSALIKHLKTCHREQFAEVQKLRKKDVVPCGQPTLDASMRTATEAPVPSTSHGKISFFRGIFSIR